MAKKISKFRKRNIFQKYSEVFLTKCLIAMKENKEYKAQFWSVLLFDIILVFVILLFFEFYGKLVFEILNWSLLDFFILFCFQLLAGKFYWMHNLRFLSQRILQGELNLYLVRPINTFFLTSIKFISGSNIITGVILLIITIFSVFIGNYQNMIYSFIILILGSIYFLIFIDFLYSFAFFIKDSKFLVEIFNHELNMNIQHYTPKLFERTSFKWIAFLLPSAIYGFFAVEALKNEFTLLLFFLPYIIISFFIMFFGIIVMWHYGLKKYEAFG